MLLPSLLLLALLRPKPCRSSETLLEVLGLHRNLVLDRFPSAEHALRHVRETREKLLDPASPAYNKQHAFIVSLHESVGSDALRSQYPENRFSSFYQRHHTVYTSPAQLIPLLQELRNDIADVLPVTAVMKTSESISKETFHCEEGNQQLSVQLAPLSHSELNEFYVWMEGVAASAEMAFGFSRSSHFDRRHWIRVDIPTCSLLTKIANLLAAQPEVLFVDIAGYAILMTITITF